MQKKCRVIWHEMPRQFMGWITLPAMQCPVILHDYLKMLPKQSRVVACVGGRESHRSQTQFWSLDGL